MILKSAIKIRNSPKYESTITNEACVLYVDGIQQYSRSLAVPFCVDNEIVGIMNCRLVSMGTRNSAIFESVSLMASVDL